MEYTWRWFGPADPITLEEIRQAGATGIVTALHEVPNGEIWPVEAIAERKRTIEAAGLTWSVVESVPVHDAIKQGSPEAERYIDNYRRTLANLGECGIDVVCYNFMPILDWTRTDLAWPLPDGGTALRFDQTAFAAFDLFLLAREGAEAEYSETEREAAQAYVGTLDDAGRAHLVDTIIAGLPGTEEHYTLEDFRRALAAYRDIDAERLRANLATFLRAIVPTAEEAGVRLAIHPDDPPRELLGLPRVVSTADDAQAILDCAPSPANGLTFCTGSYGVREDNNLVAMVERFGPYIHFAHLRATRREADPRSFHEAGHLNGDVDMVGVIGELIHERRRRQQEGGHRLPLRPDHGHHLLDDLTRDSRPGYPLIGRLKGLAELRGVACAVERLLPGR
ncbi:mannonate dehydratase [Salinicola rhizosphaerae]|uniref:Mannonate dehydratase n=1 Tax=Salinicola rhizosphaerae TaxID=1443141 RepID=A0ABQ3E0R7_9GAMM|nr:mannonate dehydratase [Salinicola rhizosphaerae]GHB19723.1 mannonate dehydratase [Salinicola rhizosphaerae]